MAAGWWAAQAHTGGRQGRRVVLVTSVGEVEREAGRILANCLVTADRCRWPPVSYILVEEPTAIAPRSCGLSALVDRATWRVLVMASRAGGMNIEEVSPRRRRRSSPR